jgi:anti-sigma factor RsiW
MKPCSKNRKQIAWLALGELDGREESALREHLANCEGCRCYWEEISSVTQRLTAAQPASDVQASEVFHRGVAEKMQTAESGSLRENLTALIRGTALNWRVALPVTAVLVIAAFASVILQQPLHPATPVLPAVRVFTSASGSESDWAPTLANYQMIASQSLGKLDAVLTRQGNRALPPMPIYTASTLTPANGSF